MSKTKSFMVWVYIAYGFYLLVGLVWALVSWLNSGTVNMYALFIMLLFGVQFYYKHLMTNLILGIVGLFLSIFSLLDAVNGAAGAAKVRPLVMGDRILIALPLVGIVMAGILVFSYIKLSFNRE